MSDQPETLCPCTAMPSPHRHVVAELPTRDDVPTRPGPGASGMPAQDATPRVRITPKNPRDIVKQRCAHCNTWATLIVRVLDTTTGDYGPIREMCERHAENARRVNELENRS